MEELEPLLHLSNCTPEQRVGHEKAAGAAIDRHVKGYYTESKTRNKFARLAAVYGVP
jgi:hypothetical protein